MTHNFTAYFEKYINLVENKDPLQAMQEVQKSHYDFFKAIGEERSNYSYAEGKWSIKDILQHIIDTERIFNYRALSFARGEQGNLLGFDHELFAVKAHANVNRHLNDLIEEYRVTKQSTYALFKSFNAEMMSAKGTANGLEIGVNQLAFLVSGHDLHHVSVIKEKYL